jgi:hypothetical protein
MGPAIGRIDGADMVDGSEERAYMFFSFVWRSTGAWMSHWFEVEVGSVLQCLGNAVFVPNLKLNLKN